MSLRDAIASALSARSPDDAIDGVLAALADAEDWSGLDEDLAIDAVRHYADTGPLAHADLVAESLTEHASLPTFDPSLQLPATRLDDDRFDDGFLDEHPLDDHLDDPIPFETAPTAPTGFEDTGLEDTGLEDTGLEDTGLEDTGLEDTGLVDTGLEDTGLEDGGLLGAAPADPFDADLGSFAGTDQVESGDGVGSLGDLDSFDGFDL